MQYKGKLYGKIGNKYFDTGKTSDDFDRLESRLQSLPVTDCNGLKEEALKIAFKEGFYQGRTNKIDDTEYRFPYFKSQHPELFKPKVIDWDDLSQRWGKYCIDNPTIYWDDIFDWLKEQPEFTTAPAEKGGKP